MHQKKFELRIGKENPFPSLSSNINPTTNPPTQYHNHLRVKIPPIPSLQNPSTPTQQTQFQNKPIFDTSSTSITLLSTPHKRSVMSQTPSTLSHSPTLSSLHHHHKKITVLDPQSSKSPFICSSSLPVFLATKNLTFKLIHHSCKSRWLKVHLKLFIIFSLPSLYFFTSYHHYWPFFLHFLYVLAFSSLLLISFTLALPQLPSIRLFLAQKFCVKFTPSGTASKPNPPVVWSIGSKPESAKRPKSGCGVQVYGNGDVYEGEFHKGKCSGSGVYYYNMSGKYEGDWVDEKYDGHGIETWAKGSRYRGQYRQGLRNGYGVYTFYTGDVYAGEWCNGQCYGCGIHNCEDGSKYVGEFKWGVKHGLGHYNFRNGDTYAGEYFADKMHGFGVYRFGNGHRYEGAWHEGRRQGLGMYTFRTGETQSGHWQNGFLNVSSSQETLTGSPFPVDHSKVLNTIQEARRAAEKAIDVAKVDERVNRATAAANKAANAARVAAVKAVQNRMYHNNDKGDVHIRIA